MSTNTTHLFVGAVTGASASVMQSTTTPSIAMLVPIISALVGGAVSYGILKGVVHAMERDVAQVRKDIGQIYDLTRDLAVKVARIEGELERDK
jgi:hypothetical protein